MEGSSERTEDNKDGTFEDGDAGNGGQMGRFVDLIGAASSSSSGSSASAAVNEEHSQRSSEVSSCSPDSMSWPLQEKPDSKPPDCSSDNGAEDDDKEKSHFPENGRKIEKQRSRISVSGAVSLPFHSVSHSALFLIVF